MFEIIVRLAERLMERPPPQSSNEDLAPWLAAVIVGALAAIVYGAPKEAYLLLALVLVLVLLFVGGKKAA